MANMKFTRRDDADVSRRDVKSLHGGGRFANCDDAQSYADGGEADVPADQPAEQPADPVGQGLLGLASAVRNFVLPSNAATPAQQAQAANMQAPPPPQMMLASHGPTGGGELVPEAQSPQHHVPAPVQQAAAPAHAAAAAGPGGAQGPYHDEIQAATDLHLAGLANEATAKAAQAKANEIATGLYQQQVQFVQDKYTKQFDDNQAKAEAIRQQILNNPIDANRLWNDTSTAGQMSTLVAMSLGGVAGAMSGRGGNQVLDLVNRAIDRDLQAQEANLGAKQGVLHDYMANGMQIQQARQLAKADALTMFSAQLEANAYKAAPGEIQAQALSQAGNILAQAQQLRLNVAETGAKVELTRAEAQKDHLANSMTALELNWLRGQQGGQGGGQGGAPGANPGMVNNFMAAKVMGPQFLGSQIPGIGAVWNPDLRKQISDTLPSMVQAHHSLDVLQQNPETLGKLLAGTIGASSGQANINSQLENLRAQMPLIAQAAPGRMRAKLTGAMVPHARELLMPAGQQKLQDIRDTLLEVAKSWRIANGSGQ